MSTPSSSPGVAVKHIQAVFATNDLNFSGSEYIKVSASSTITRDVSSGAKSYPTLYSTEEGSSKSYI
jgi:hypothetical protein